MSNINTPRDPRKFRKYFCWLIGHTWEPYRVGITAKCVYCSKPELKPRGLF